MEERMKAGGLRRRETQTMIEATNRIKDIALDWVLEAGAILMRHFGRVRNVRQKENATSVVCEADLDSEKHLVRRIRAWFPEDGIIAEESGCRAGSSELIWVIDPLDGTSNFVAGIPWFGVQLGVLRQAVPIFAAMYLPAENSLYHAAAGGGAGKNGKSVSVTSESRLRNVLCGFGFDARTAQERRLAQAKMLGRVAGGVRNTRATNSLVDFCLTVDGRFGGFINLNCRIWDIVPVSLILPEAGGKFTDLEGRNIHFQLGPKAGQRVYGVLGASQALHSKLLALARDSSRSTKK